MKLEKLGPVGPEEFSTGGTLLILNPANMLLPQKTKGLP